MTQKNLEQYLWKKWGNYSRGLAMSFSFRKDKNYTFNDVKEAYESGFYEFQQILYKNNINLEDIDLW